jgi:hypothetical protein
MSSRREKSGEFPTPRKNRIKYGVQAAIMIGLTLFGAKTGYDINKGKQNASDASRRDKAAAISRCIDLANSPSALRIESGRAVLRLSALTEQQKEDCGLSSAEDSLEPYDRHSGVGVELPDGAEIIKSDVKVKLASTEDLQASAEGELSKANNGVTTIDGLERAGASLAGAGVGGAVGFLIALNAGVAIPGGRRQG